MATPESSKIQEDLQPEKPRQTIREYLSNYPHESTRIRLAEKCARCGISLDSPWPPDFPPIDSIAPAPSPELTRPATHEPSQGLKRLDLTQSMGELSKLGGQSGAQQPRAALDAGRPEMNNAPTPTSVPITPEQKAHEQAAKFLEKQLEAEHPDLDADMRASLARLGASMAKRSSAKAETGAQPSQPQPKAPETAQIIPFPQWPDERRAAMQAAFRSALFPALNFKAGRPFLKEKKIASVEGVDVIFTGEQFDQSDLDVFLELLNIASENLFGVECHFSAYSLLKALGRATGNKDHKWLHSALIRLCSGTVDMTDHKVRYFGHLVEGGFKDEITKHYTVSINPKWARFFKSGMWASLDNGQRRALGRSQIAKALHAYYATHTAPSPHRYETLAALIGLQDKSSRQVKSNLIKAHEELKQVGFLSDYEAGINTIKATINHTPSQTLHLAKKIAKTRRPRPPKLTG